MTISYKTDRLLPHLVALGVLLIPVGIGLIVSSNYIGIALTIIGACLFFFRHGFTIDATQMQLRTHAGIGPLKYGHWHDISEAHNLQIINGNTSQSMSMLSINRTSYQEATMLYLVLPNENIKLMSGQKHKILRVAQKIALASKIELIDKTEKPH